MPTSRRTLIILILLAVFSGAHASESAKEEKSAEESDSSLDGAPWHEVEYKVGELNSKIKSKYSILNKLFEEKSKARENSAQLKAVVKEIIKNHQELRSLVDEYTKQLNIFKYRFPERAGRSGKKFDRFDVKSVEEMEHSLDLDGRLTQTMKKLRSQYRIENTPASAGSSVTSTTMPSKEGSIEDAETVILQK